MDVSKKYILIQTLSLSVLFFIIFAVLQSQKNIFVTHYKQVLAPTPTPFNPFPYKLPKISNSRSYLTVLVGDSMVESLGPNANLLRQHLIALYPTHEFVNYNYGFGATNITTLPERLSENTVHKGQNFPAILSQGFDLIIIESFAYNPLSELKKGEDISKHIQIMDESIKKIIQSHPESIVAIMVTIAPNKSYYAKGVYELSDKERIQWVEERTLYVEAVIKYSNEKEIPLINVYEKSLTSAGDGDLKYINSDDYIHPSSDGVDLISRTIADYIFSEKLFPE